MAQKQTKFSTEGLSVQSSRLGSPNHNCDDSRSSYLTQEPSSFFAVLLTYPVYYACSLLWNFCLIAFYTVQTFSTHESCFTKTSSNITDRFEFAFQIGFTVHVADFLNTNLVGIYLRAKMAEEEKRYGYSKDSTYWLMIVSSYAEWVLRISIITVSWL